MKSRASRNPDCLRATVEPRWRRALGTFLRDWQRRDEVVAALLFGSRVHGTSTKHSDVDVHLILTRKTPWREHGTCCIDGILVEYFATPESAYAALHEAGIERNWAGVARMLAHAEVLFDKTGAASRVQRWATEALRRPLKRSGAKVREAAKFAMWDGLDGLRMLHQRGSPGFWHYYHQVLDRTLTDYGKALGAEVPAKVRTWEHLTSAQFRRAHRFPAFPDPKFAALAAKCARECDGRTALVRIERLIDHAQSRMGGFTLDGWRVRTPVLR